MSDIEKKFQLPSDHGVELEHLQTRELIMRWNDIQFVIEKYRHGKDLSAEVDEADWAFLVKTRRDTMDWGIIAIDDSSRKLKLLQTIKDKLDEQAAHIERLEATIKAHGLDVDR